MIDRKNIPYFMAVFALLIFTSCASVSKTSGSGALYQWTQYGPNQTTVARAITESASCPMITIDGAASQMSTRAAASTDSTASFPVLSCEASIPSGAKSATINDAALPLPKSDPKRIIVVGDSGCRIKSGSAVQDCSDPDAWPWQKISDMAASKNPDLVIHVGDYHYRESCPAGVDCSGMIIGYGWDAWEADMFRPAQNLLKAAPWIVMRGNHEDCDRAGEGWERFLSPYAYSPTCTDFAAPYTISINPNLGLYVVDTGKITDGKVVQSEVDNMTSQFESITAGSGESIWLLSHKPLWDQESTIFGTTMNSLMTAAHYLPDSVTAVFSGHSHIYEYLTFPSTRPAQIIVGNSGDELDNMPDQSLVNVTFDGMNTSAGAMAAQFGFLVLDKGEGGKWSGVMYRPNGDVMTTCELNGKSFTCAAIGN